MALTTIKTGGLANNSVTDAKVADAITVTGAQTGITQVGTLTAGTWNGTAIASAYLDADTAHLSGSTFTGSVQISHGTTPDFTLNDTGGTTNKRVFRISGGGDAVYFEGRNNGNTDVGAVGAIQTLSLSDASTTFAGDVAVSSSDPTITIKRSNSSSYAGHLDFTNNADALGWQVGTNQVAGDGFEVNYGASNKFYVTTGGNVGIGTGGNNDRLLHVQGGASSNTGVIKIEGGQPWLEMQSAANTWSMYVGDAGGGDFYIRDGDPTGGADYVTINAGDGFVGINHGDPKKMLHIRKNNSDCMVILDAQDSIADKQICFAEDYGSGSTSDGQYWGVGVDASEGPDFVIAYDQNAQPSMGGDDDLVRITAGGIMTFSMGDAAAQFAEYESGGIIWLDGADGNLSGGDYWGLQAVNGGGSFRIKRAGTTKVTVDSSGNMDIAGTLTESSDIRLKENIKAIPNALSKVNQMRGVHFNKKGSDEKLVGMIADEVEKIIPELVTTATEKGELDTEALDNLKSLRYSNIVAVLVEAVKELSAEVEALKNG